LLNIENLLKDFIWINQESFISLLHWFTWFWICYWYWKDL